MGTLDDEMDPLAVDGLELVDPFTVVDKLRSIVDDEFPLSGVVEWTDEMCVPV